MLRKGRVGNIRAALWEGDVAYSQCTVNVVSHCSSTKPDKIITFSPFEHLCKQS